MKLCGKTYDETMCECIAYTDEGEIKKAWSEKTPIPVLMARAITAGAYTSIYTREDVYTAGGHIIPKDECIYQRWLGDDSIVPHVSVNAYALDDMAAMLTDAVLARVKQ